MDSWCWVDVVGENHTGSDVGCVLMLWLECVEDFLGQPSWNMWWRNFLLE